MVTFKMGRGVSERRVSKLSNALRVQTSDVKSPSKRNRPHPMEIVCRIKLNIVRSCRVIHEIDPKNKSAPPAAARSKTRPTPGAPSGNIGKLDRSVNLVNFKSLVDLEVKRIPKDWSLFVPLLRYL
jgi:hypothetical protein